jgi:hypothetical protein
MGGSGGVSGGAADVYHPLRNCFVTFLRQAPARPPEAPPGCACTHALPSADRPDSERRRRPKMRTLPARLAWLLRLGLPLIDGK